MLSAIMIYVLLLPAAAQGAVEPERPACSSALEGQFWPLQANSDRKLASKLARCGQLDMCSRGMFRYRWRSMTVRVDQLSRKAELKAPAGCDASVEDPSADREIPKTSTDLN